MAQTANERKAAERAAKRKAGMVPMEIWTRPEHQDKVRKYVERLNRPARSAGESR